MPGVAPGAVLPPLGLAEWGTPPGYPLLAASVSAALNVCVSCVTVASYSSLGMSGDLRDDRPSTGPLERSEKAALVSGSSSSLRRARRRPRVSAG